MEERVKLDIFLRTLLNVSNYYSIYPENKKDLPVFKFFEPIAKVKTNYNKEDLVDFVSVKIPDSKALINKGYEVSLKALEDYIRINTSGLIEPSGIYFAHYLLPEISFELLVFMIDSYYIYYKKQCLYSGDTKEVAKRIIQFYNMLSDITEEDSKQNLINNKIMGLNYIIKNINGK